MSESPTAPGGAEIAATPAARPIPRSVSSEAQDYLAVGTDFDSAPPEPALDDIEGWLRHIALMNDLALRWTAPNVPSTDELERRPDVIGGVPVHVLRSTRPEPRDLPALSWRSTAAA